MTPSALQRIWKLGERPAPDGPVHVSMNDFVIHRLRDVPRVGWEGIGFRRNWPKTEGALGLCTAAEADQGRREHAGHPAHER